MPKKCCDLDIKVVFLRSESYLVTASVMLLNLYLSLKRRFTSGESIFILLSLFLLVYYTRFIWCYL